MDTEITEARRTRRGFVMDHVVGTLGVESRSGYTRLPALQSLRVLRASVPSVLFPANLVERSHHR